MFYYPATNVWVDLGNGKYIDQFTPSQLDPNGHAYPISTAKWGFYDAVTDKYYIPQGDSGLMVLDAATLAMEWPMMQIGYGAPWSLYDQAFYTACLCFDKKRRRLVTLKSQNNGDLTDPNGMKLLCIDIDLSNGTRSAYMLPQTGFAVDPGEPNGH